MLLTRLENQRLVGSTVSRPEEIVSWLGAVQAQDYVGAKWALALRTRDANDDDVERAFADGRILRTHVLRPTWHFVTPADIRWMLALTGPRLQRLNRGYARTLGLDARTLDRSAAVIQRALEGKGALTREELSRVLGKARIDATGQRLAHLLMELEVRAIVCSGPRRGTQFTYALLSERAPASRVLDREPALAELARRYFQSHGPATVKDFSWWSGLTIRDAREAVALAGVSTLGTAPTLQRAEHATYLLPNYDEYLIAYRDRGAVIDPKRSRNLGVFTTTELPHHLVIAGRVAGSWRRTISTNALAIELAPYRRLTRPERKAVEDQAQRYGRFLSLPATIS